MRRIYKPIIRWCQRRYRGWDDSDTWSIECAMAKLMLPRLQRMRKIAREIVGPSATFWNGTMDLADPERIYWDAAEKRQDEVYDDVEYFLAKMAEGEDGWDLTDEIDRHLKINTLCADGTIKEGRSIPVHKRVKDERFFRGRRYLVRYIRTMGW